MLQGAGYDPDELLTVKYLAEITHCSQATITRYIRKFDIPIFNHKEGLRGLYKVKIRREDWRIFLYQHYSDATPRRGTNQHTRKIA